MYSNHYNIFNEILALAQGRYIVLHAKLNFTGAGGGDGNGNASGEGRYGRDRIGERGDDGAHGSRQKNIREGVEKKSLLLGSMQEYGDGYEESTKPGCQFGSDRITYETAGAEE